MAPCTTVLMGLVTSGLLLLSLGAAYTAGEKQDELEVSVQRRQLHNTDPPPSIPTHPSQPSSQPRDPLSSWLSSAQSPSPSSPRPNVLFLIVDDLRPKLGCYGEANMVTPNIDQLASRSLLFNRAYAQQAVCGPSRTSFLTGRRPDTTRVLDLVTYWRTAAGNFTTLPQYFKNHGYTTQGVGKIFHPGVASGNDYDAAYSWTESPYLGFPSIEPENSFEEYHKLAVRPVDEGTEGKLQDTDIADFAVQWLANYSAHNSAEQDSKPFFLAVGFHKPHLPFMYPKQFESLYPITSISLPAQRVRPPGMPDIAWSNYGELRKFRDIIALNVSDPYGPIPEFYQYRLRQGYSAATSYSDHLVGRVLEALEVNMLSRNTFIVFLGDHGWQLGENGEWSKHTDFEIAVRVPLMLHVPGVTGVTSSFVPTTTTTTTTSTTPATPTASTPPPVLFPLIDTLSSTPGQYSAASSNGWVSDSLVELVDLFPTVTELAGLPVPATCPHDSLRVPTCTEGTSLVPLLKAAVSAAPSSGPSSSSSTAAGARRRSARLSSSGSSYYGFSSSDRNRNTDAKFEIDLDPESNSFNLDPEPNNRDLDLDLNWKEAAFSQFHRNLHSDRPVMGYTVRTASHRYTEWVGYDLATYTGNFSDVLARELYVEADDPLEAHNVAEEASNADLVARLSQLLRKGWRGALDQYLGAA